MALGAGTPGDRRPAAKPPVAGRGPRRVIRPGAQGAEHRGFASFQPPVDKARSPARHPRIAPSGVYQARSVPADSGPAEPGDEDRRGFPAAGKRRAAGSP